jgi:hypothetical protein
MAVTPLPIVIDVNAAHLSNAIAPMVVTLSGITTEVMAVPLNALVPMVTVGLPPSVAGMFNAPPLPVYPVTVALPPLTV